MKIICVADLHGHLPEIPACDLLIIAGDLVPLEIQDNAQLSKHWIDNKFYNWYKDQPVKEVIIIAGNHDYVCEYYGKRILDKDFPPSLDLNIHTAHYLQDESIVIDDFKIYGSPWTPWFWNWAFNAPRADIAEDFLTEKWSKIPDDTNILITHGPPHGILDSNGLELLGSKSLRKRVDQLDKLKLHVFGHIHNAAGIQHLNDKTFVNACVVNNKYQLTHTPTEIILE